MPPPEPSVSTQRILPGAHRVGEPRDADLALAAGEAAERGDVGAAVDDRRRRALLARHGDRAAAVGLGVGDRRGQRGAVAAERPAAGRRRPPPRRAAGRRPRAAGRREPVPPCAEPPAARAAAALRRAAGGAKPPPPPRPRPAAAAARTAEALRGGAAGRERAARRVAERLHRPGRRARAAARRGPRRARRPRTRARRASSASAIAAEHADRQQDLRHPAGAPSALRDDGELGRDAGGDRERAERSARRGRPSAAARRRRRPARP